MIQGEAGGQALAGDPSNDGPLRIGALPQP
jgi:hypothetical protein